MEVQNYSDVLRHHTVASAGFEPAALSPDEMPSDLRKHCLHNVFRVPQLRSVRSGRVSQVDLNRLSSRM